jgi:hypothetical protein
MDATSRPAWGCLDAQEMRDAAAGHAEPAVREHLGRCSQCRRAVGELRGDLRRPVATGRMRYRRSLLLRPGFWLLLLVLAALAYGVKVLVLDKRPPPPPPPVTTADPAPVAAPEKRPPVRRARPRRTASASGDANAEIVDVIRRNQTGVRMCYERALKRDPRLSLQIEVRVNVSAAGVVDRVSLDGLPEGAPLSNCIRNTIKTWQFPRGPAAYETAFPLRLQQRVQGL